jgi:hypothetical protein
VSRKRAAVNVANMTEHDRHAILLQLGVMGVLERDRVEAEAPPVEQPEHVENLAQAWRDRAIEARDELARAHAAPGLFKPTYVGALGFVLDSSVQQSAYWQSLGADS